ncbi:MAG: acyl-CoA thioesterase II [Actinomyces sp.]|nr:MAG: acyl-CoA thioesterase II [Actinomyces sp.]
MLDLAEHGPDTYVGRSAVYPWDRVYGGQVVAQGLWAAIRTVEPSHRVHSVHAYFIRGGDQSEPIRFEVDRIRNGRSFVTRRVVARQSFGAILNLSASFHRREEAPDTTALPFPADVPPPEELEPADWGPLMERRPVPGDGPRVRSWLRVVGPLGEDPGVHAVAHAYASDDLATEAVMVTHPRGRPDWGSGDAEWPYMGASLDHTVWFHRDAPADDWLLHDLRGVGVYGARGLALGEVWTRDGVHVATIAQEVLLRERRRPDGDGTTTGSAP